MTLWFRHTAASVALSIALSGGFPLSVAADPIADQLNKVQKLEGAANHSEYADALFDLAVRYNNVGDIAHARDYFEKALAVEQTLKRPRNELETRMLLARCYLSLKDMDTALKMFRDADAFAAANSLRGHGATTTGVGGTLLQCGRVKEAEQVLREGLASCDDPLARSSILRNLAQICTSSARFDEAFKLQQQAIDILAKDGDEADYGISMIELAKIQDLAGNPRDSATTLENTQKKFDANMFPEVQTYADLGMGRNFSNRDRVRDAKNCFERAVKFAREVKEDPRALLDALISLGAAESDLAEFDNAEKHLSEAVQQAGQFGYVDSLVDAEMQLANTQLYQGHAERALQALTKTLQRTNSTSVEKHAMVLSSLGRCYATLGQRKAAEKYYRDAINQFAELNDVADKAIALNSLAVLSLDAGDYAGFDRINDETKDIAEKLPPRDQAKLQYNEAQSKLMRRQYDPAIAIYKDALTKAQNAGDEGVQSSILRGLGAANYLAGHYSDGLEYFEKALAMSHNSDSIEALWDCNLGVGKCYKALGKYDQAEPYLRKAVSLVEAERSSMTRDSFKTANLDLRKDCFQELVDLLFSANRPYESLEIAERGKARAFLDMLANKRDRRIASVDLNAPAISTEPAPAGQLVAMAGAHDGTRSVNVTSKSVDDSEDSALEETAISPVNADAPSIDEIKNLVARRRSTCVEYLMAGGKIYTWVVHPDGSINLVPPVAVPKDFTARVRDVLTNMTKAAKTPVEIAALATVRQTQLRSMYDLLVKPLEQYLPKNKDEVVTILPHDVLFCIPFAALMASNGDYLIEQHTLSYAPAIGVFRATQKLEEQADQMPHKLLAFGNPITKRIAFIGTLPYAEKEVKHIASLYPPSDTTIEIGEAATKEAFEKLVPKASEIHLATHGLVDEEHPMKSSVVLAPTDTDDGLLSVRDILTLKNLKARLVVLSACQTGRGKITGDGVVGLSRAFIIAGAPSVLVSQWNVDDIMTDFQMEKFYRFYLKGSDRAKALRDAQLATIRYMENTPDGQAVAHSASQARANPRYWAAFQLIGEI